MSLSRKRMARWRLWRWPSVLPVRRELGTAARHRAGPAEDIPARRRGSDQLCRSEWSAWSAAFVGRFDMFVDHRVGQGVADSVSGFGGQAAQRDQQVAFPAGQLADDRRVDDRVSLKGELLQSLWSGEAGPSSTSFRP